MCVARCVCLLRVDCRFLVTVFMPWELYCSLFVVCCLLCLVCRLLCVACCMFCVLCVVCCLLVVACCWLFVECCLLLGLLFGVWRLCLAFGVRSL